MPFYPHYQTRMKKPNEIKETKLTEIERENRILLEKIHTIFVDKKP